MSDIKPPAKNADQPTSDKPADEWKPEPRQWTWKDLFTAPMLAFKPKCMLVSALTLTLLGAWWWLADYLKIGATPDSYGYGADAATAVSLPIATTLAWTWNTVALIIFSLGASLVAVFLKADLLDDEFLSLGEALSQYRSRVIPAVMVPLFLMVLLAGVNLGLVYLPCLVGSIPYGGPVLYALFYPLGYCFSLFAIFLGIAVCLSVFVFPAIIAIRKHGWFDNVVDTIEAVGTKPHILFASLLLSLVIMLFAYWIGLKGIDNLKDQKTYLPNNRVTYTPGTGEAPTELNGLIQTERRASDFYADEIVSRFQRLVRDTLLSRALSDLPILPSRSSGIPVNSNSFYYYGTGPVTGLWQSLIEVLVIGYVLNLFVAGGMLTYLVVREDDYWDDEDLEDLDKLAQELEEEAKRDQAASPTVATIAPTAGKPAPAAPAAVPPKPPEPPRATPPAPATPPKPS
jgi:hypothetical protein